MTVPAPSPAPATVAEDARLDEALRQLRALLLPGETLEAWAVQRRLFALVQPRLIVAATSGRFIILDRRLLGGYSLSDVRWQDLRDASLQAGIFGADLTITALVDGELAAGDASGRSVTHVLAGLRKDQAQEVYRLCQAQEQSWREKRRIRDLDELRARSGGIQLGGAPAPGMGASASAPAADDPTSRLRRAKEMLDAGLLTDAEYETIKSRIIEGL